MAPGVGILKTYGQTETFRSSCLLPDQIGARPDSVGRAFPGARIYIVDEDGQRCAPGEIGQVVHTGLGVMHGYLNGGTEDKKVPNPFYGPEDGSPAAILTGDFGFLDADGYLFLMGRRDDMVKVSGNRVYLAEVVAGMLKLETLALADVVPVKAEDDGETTLVAFVACKKPGGDGDVIRREVAKLLPSYMVPQHVILLDDFPHTESGKIDRVSLKVRAVDYVTSAAFRENAPSRGRPAE
jgi:acyl-coenzyme A synthetase/AMP-(fatty) acid ligase